MAVALLSDEVSDLTLGKPVLPCLLATSSVRHALLVLKHHRDFSEISIWDCTPSPVGSGRAGIIFPSSIAYTDSRDKEVQAVGGENYASECPSLKGEWRCVGKVCMQKIICYLALDRCLVNIEEALDALITILLQNEPHCTIQLVDPHDSVIDALSFVAAGMQNLVVPMSSHFPKYGSYSKFAFDMGGGPTFLSAPRFVGVAPLGAAAATATEVPEELQSAFLHLTIPVPLPEVPPHELCVAWNPKDSIGCAFDLIEDTHNSSQTACYSGPLVNLAVEAIGINTMKLMLIASIIYEDLAADLHHESVTTKLNDVLCYKHERTVLRHAMCIEQGRIILQYVLLYFMIVFIFGTLHPSQGPHKILTC